jgi:ElaA protein
MESKKTAIDNLDINWEYQHYSELNKDTLYQILALRSEVFVLEQQCIYTDADFKDQQSWHLCGWKNGKLQAYARVIPPGISYPEASIGRVLTAASARKSGLGKWLMQIAIQQCRQQFPEHPIKIGAQLYLLEFYRNLGFQPIGETYLEDGIPHIIMLL